MDSNKLLLYENLIGTMSEGVMVFDDNGNVILCNDKAGELLDLQPPFEGLTLKYFLQNMEGRYDEFGDAVVEAIYEKETRHNFTVSYSSDKGDRRYLVSTGYLKGEGDSNNVLALINDISELEKLHETFGRYVSDDIAKAILETPGGLDMGGDERSVTILMSDLRGFTAMSEKMKPSDIVDMLNYYFGVMLECITRNNGNVIEFLGDGIFVVFGAPIASENHAAEAVAAAVEMERAMADVNKWNVERGYPELSMGIGINTGSAVVGNIGCEKRTKYGVLGSNVNLTGRIESYTVAGQILISPTTREQIAEDLIIEQEADVSPKGVDGVLHLTQVIGIGGDYNVSYEIVRKPLFGLDMPHVITYRSLEGKHVSDESYLGKILAVSEEQVLLESPHDLEVFDNIRMDLAGETYGKVIKKTDEGYLIDFTALPESFRIWFDAITQGSRD